MTLTQPEMAAHDKTTWKLYDQCGRADAKLQSSQRAYDQAMKPGAPVYMRSSLVRYAEYLTEARTALEAATARLETHEASYAGWARFWCVPNGHIHRSRNCSTCNHNGRSTAFYLAHEVSGMDEAAAVAAQGPVLCTTCFPSAPTEWTNGLDEAAKAKKAAQCAGSGKYMDNALPHRTGFYSGNWATCPDCKGQITITTGYKLRAHKPAAA